MAAVSSFLLLHNVGKRQNFGSIIRSAVAFGVREVFVVGERKLLKTFGDQGTSRSVTLVICDSLSQAEGLLRSRGAAVCGIELTPSARPVHEQPFSRSTAFMVGNEAGGLNAKQMAICDTFVYIPQFSAGTASLNVAVAASIVLYHFAVWAGFSEQPRETQRHKFQVQRPRGKLEAFTSPSEEEKRQFEAVRAKRSQALQSTSSSCSTLYLNTLFSAAEDDAA